MSDAAKKQAQQIASNLGKVFAGINGTGHKDIPKPLPEAGADRREAKVQGQQPVKEKLSDVVFKNLRG